MEYTDIDEKAAESVEYLILACFSDEKGIEDGATETAHDEAQSEIASLSLNEADIQS